MKVIHIQQKHTWGFHLPFGLCCAARSSLVMLGSSSSEPLFPGGPEIPRRDSEWVAMLFARDYMPLRIITLLIYDGFRCDPIANHGAFVYLSAVSYFFSNNDSGQLKS